MAKASGGIDLQAYNKASQEAINYLSFDSQTGLTIGQANLNSKVNISGGGIKLYDEEGKVGTEIKSGFVQVGQSDDGHTTIQEDGMDIYGGDGTVKLAHIGYDSAEGESGTSIAPYYTFGTRIEESLIGKCSVVEGENNCATGECSHAEGQWTFADGHYSHAEGYNTYAGSRAHAEGDGGLRSSSNTYQAIRAVGAGSHAEGFVQYANSAYQIYALGAGSHAEGYGPVSAKGTASHAEGRHTEVTINGNYAHAEGYGTIADATAQHVQGQFNVQDSSGAYADIVGWGSASNPKNIFALSTGGDGRYKGDVYVGCNNDSTGGRKLVSASITTGNGTKSNVPSGASNLTNLAEVSLDEEGVYLLLGRVRFASNTSGRRGAAWASNSTGYFYHSLVVGAPASGGATLMQTMAIIEVTSNTAPYTAYLNCYHTAGASNPLDVEYYWRYIKLA